MSLQESIFGPLYASSNLYLLNKIHLQFNWTGLIPELESFALASVIVS
jgi:hypothetical protein